VDGLLATQNEDVGLIVVQLISKISNLCDPDLPTLLTTDRQSDGADGRNAISIPRFALKCIAR